MKDLKEEFIGRGQVKGFRFTQIKKNSHAFLYEITDGINVWYEVFHRKINSRYNCISYPSNKAFGVWAWTYHTIEKAQDRFDNITDQCQIKKLMEVLNGKG